jgi:hypothetical protein
VLYRHRQPPNHSTLRSTIHRLRRSLKRFARSAKQDDDLHSIPDVRSLVSPLPPKSVRSGVLSRLFDTNDGQVIFSLAFLDAFADKAREWVDGKLVVDQYGEVIAHAVAMTIRGNRRRALWAGEEDLKYITGQFTTQVFHLITRLAQRNGILVGSSKISIDPEFLSPIMQLMAKFGGSMETESDVRDFVIQQILQAVESRLLANGGQLNKYAHPLTMLVYTIFEKQPAYREYLDIVLKPESNVSSK